MRAFVDPEDGPSPRPRRRQAAGESGADLTMLSSNLRDASRRRSILTGELNAFTVDMRATVLGRDRGDLQCPWENLSAIPQSDLLS